MIARRLLMGASQIGEFPSRAFELAAAPTGGWCWFSDPRAISYGGYTYVGILDGSGNVKVMVVRESDRSVQATVTLHASYEVDDHDNPALYVRPSDKRLMCFYSKHLGSNTVRIKSVNTLDADPTLSGGFGSETTATFGESGGDLFTYANPVYQSNQDGSGAVLTEFYRLHVGGTTAQWHYVQSTDDGDTWGGHVHLHTLTYSRVISDGVGRIDVVAARHPNGGDGDPKGVYHLYREASAWHKSDGTTISASLPFGTADITTVYTNGADPVWIWDIAYGADGRPRIAFSVYPSTSDHRYWWARWTGSSWDTHEIVAGGGYLPTAAVGGNPIEAYYSGGMALDHSDTNVVYCSVGLGSDEWEVRRYVTADDGSSWSYRVVSRAGGKNARPYGVRDHGTTIEAVYWRGTFASYVDYSLGTDGIGA